MNARVFAINDANIQQVEAHFMALWRDVFPCWIIP